MDQATLIGLFTESSTSIVRWVERVCSLFNLGHWQQCNGHELRWSLT